MELKSVASFAAVGLWVLPGQDAGAKPLDAFSISVPKIAETGIKSPKNLHFP